jgi:hypothetical protein
MQLAQDEGPAQMYRQLATPFLLSFGKKAIDQVGCVELELNNSNYIEKQVKSQTRIKFETRR